MLYRIGADLVLLAHFIFAAFAVFGGLLAFHNSAWPWLHIPVVLWSSVVNLMSWTCPLTPRKTPCGFAPAGLDTPADSYSTTSGAQFIHAECRVSWSLWPASQLSSAMLCCT